MVNFPAYPRKPHKSGAARINVPTSEGKRKSVYLGEFGSQESREEYRRLMAQWDAAKVGGAMPWEGEIKSVAALVERFWVGLEADRADGLLSAHEVRDFRYSARPLLALYGSCPVQEFGPAKLEAVHLAMMTGSWVDDETRAKLKKQGNRWILCRRTANQRLGRLKRIFRWGARKELIPWEVYHKISAAEGERRRRQSDPPEIMPANPDDVTATIQHLGPVVGAMVQIQRLSGMRPGELCAMTPGQIKRDGPQGVWIYEPDQHKAKHLGRVARIVLGPTVQALLAPYLLRGPDMPCFSPAEEMAAIQSERRANGSTVRKTIKGFRVRKFTDRYTTASYGRRIKETCARHKIPHWTPHQLRHLAEYEIEHRFDLDSARAVLRHRDPRITVRYGKHDVEKAASVAVKMG